MAHMLGKLEGYIDKKRLEVNVGKTKVMRFKEGGGRRKAVKWRWKRKQIEEVKEFTYLGYKTQRNGGQETYVKDRCKEGRSGKEERIRQVWGKGGLREIGKEEFGYVRGW